MIPLSEFMPPFEESGFIRKIDYFIFESALQFLQRRLEQGLPVVPISLNLSKSPSATSPFLRTNSSPSSSAIMSLPVSSNSNCLKA